MPDDDYKTSGPLTIDAFVEITPPSEPDLSPDGTRIVYVQAVGDVRQLFSIPVKGGWSTRLTAGEKSCESPRWSPDGGGIAFVRDKALVVIDADGANPGTLVEHSAGLSLPRWSPDAAQIAFYSRQRGWSQIWVVPAAPNGEKREARRLTTAPADSDDLAWSPDGSRVACSSIRGDDLFNRDIYVVDVATGVEKRLTDAPGCFDGAPAWSPDGSQIAFLSDQDGWIHVCVMNSDGSNRRQLTYGACEDGWPNLNRGHLLWSPDGTALTFVRNREASIDLMTANLAGTVRCISRCDGMHQPFGWLPDGSAVACLVARPDAPPDLWLFPLAGEPRQITRSLAGGLHAEDFVLPERVAFESGDGLTLHGLLYKPRGVEDGDRRPAIVNPHGGPTGQSLLTWSEQILQIFVQEGYAVLQPDFRGSSGYGKEFRQANMGVWGVDDTADCVAAARFLQSRPWVDGDRIGIWGGSYGGYLVLCALIAEPGLFRAGIDLYGDSEIAESYRHGDRVGRLDLHRQMGSPEENVATYRLGSPVYQAERIEAPLLILHGKDDLRVVPLMSERMIEALRIEGKFFEQQFYEGEAHGFRKPAARRDAARRMLKFFAKYLKG